MHVRMGLAGATIAIWVGCTHTSVTSRVNPDVELGNVSSVVALADFWNLNQRQVAESRVCEELVKFTDCDCSLGVDVFFPGEEYSESEIKNRLSELGVDAVLVISPVDSGTSTTYVPGQSYSTTTWSTIGGSNTAKTTTTTSPGYTVSKPWAKAEAHMATVEGEVIWYATLTTGGNAFSSWRDVSRSMATEVAVSIAKDQVLPATPLQQLMSLPGEDYDFIVESSLNKVGLRFHPQAGKVRIEILDKRRAHVATLNPSPQEAELGLVTWNCRSDRGSRVRKGRYDYYVFGVGGARTVGQIRIE